MERLELKVVLQEMGVTQRQLARLVDVSARAVNLWMTGTRNVPGPVAAYLKLLGSLPPAMRQAELAKRIEEITTMRDGMYMIQYQGGQGAGFCTLVFDGGRIFGADVAGGQYDGQYQFNDGTGLVDVDLRVQLPANQPSVIGITNPFDWILKVKTAMSPEKEADTINVQTDLNRPIVATYRFLRPLPDAA